MNIIWFLSSLKYVPFYWFWLEVIHSKTKQNVYWVCKKENSSTSGVKQYIFNILMWLRSYPRAESVPLPPTLVTQVCVVHSLDVSTCPPSLLRRRDHRGSLCSGGRWEHCSSSSFRGAGGRGGAVEWGGARARTHIQVLRADRGRSWGPEFALPAGWGPGTYCWPWSS